MSHSREPIQQTCPDINKMIRCIAEAQRTINRLGRNPDESELKDAISECENALSECENFLDDKMRNANDKLRQWGVSEAETVDSLSKELADAEYDRDEAQETLKEVTKERDELKSQHDLLHDYVRCA